MKRNAIPPYLANCFWLLLPILAFNAIFAKYLPPQYQSASFWNNIPAWIAIPENLLRLPVFLLPVMMRFPVSSLRRTLGLALYIAGTSIYFAAWAMQIAFPESSCATSILGFMAPAYTPILWIVGIGLIGNTAIFHPLPYQPWIYFSLSGLFLVFHNLHTWLVYTRQS